MAFAANSTRCCRPTVAGLGSTGRAPTSLTAAASRSWRRSTGRACRVPGRRAHRGCRHVVFTRPARTGRLAAERDLDPLGGSIRSPCGTGTSAKLAQLHARGELAVGEEVRRPFCDRDALFGGGSCGDRGGGWPWWCRRSAGARGSRHGPVRARSEDPFPADSYLRARADVAIVGRGIVAARSASSWAGRGVAVRRSTGARCLGDHRPGEGNALAARGARAELGLAAWARGSTTRSRSCSAPRRGSAQGRLSFMRIGAPGRRRPTGWTACARLASSACCSCRRRSGRWSGAERRVSGARSSGATRGRPVSDRPRARARRRRWAGRRAVRGGVGDGAGGCVRGSRDRADAVVIAAGAWSGPLARGAGSSFRSSVAGVSCCGWSAAWLPARQGDRRLVHGRWRARGRGPSTPSSRRRRRRRAGRLEPERRGFDLSVDPVVSEVLSSRRHGSPRESGAGA